MNKRFILLALTSSLLFTSCSAPFIEIEDSDNTPHEYLDERDYQYENKLEKPSNVVNNIDDLRAITDYYAFYKVPRFTVDVSNYIFYTSNKSINEEINYLYWYGELVNGVMGITAKALNKRTWEINYVFYHNFHINANETYPIMKDYFYTTPSGKRASDYNDFATEDESKPICDVASSQQLWYAAEHGYRINPLPGTPAENYYNQSKTILRDIISNDMTDYQKTAVIYDYIEHHSTYCYEALNALESEDPVNFPDKYCAEYKAFFLEGFFDNHTVVCDGYSKVMTLWSRMEGIEVVRGSGTSDKRWVSKEVAGHAYCYVPYEGEYYLACPTWGQRVLKNGKTVTLKSYFMVPKTRIKPYDNDDWDFAYSTSSHNDLYFKDVTFTYEEQNYDLYIESLEEYNILNSYLRDNLLTGGYVNFYVPNSNTYSQIKSQLDSQFKYSYVVDQYTKEFIIY